jgi:uncharacterized protein
MSIIKEVRKFVEEETLKPTSKYGYEPFLYHFTPTVKYATKLADKLGADKEVVVIAAWLHDIGSVMKGRKDHHLTGVKIAEKKLKELGYPKEKIELVKKCILNHRGSQKNNPTTIEERIIADADTLSNFDNLSGIFKAAFIYENLDQKEAQKAVKKKLENKWKQLYFEDSKEIIRPKYEAIRTVLK